MLSLPFKAVVTSVWVIYDDQGKENLKVTQKYLRSFVTFFGMDHPRPANCEMACTMCTRSQSVGLIERRTCVWYRIGSS
jgi:hypothetical protein